MSASDERGGLIFTDVGPTSPTAEDIRNRLAVILRETFGVDLDVATETPQGQLLDSWTSIVFDKNNSLIFLVEQWNPETAEGRYQDNINKIYFHNRKPAQPTLVNCVCIGRRFITIPAGSLAEDNLGRQFQAVDPIIIGSDGTGTGYFAALTPGPVSVPAETLQTIVSGDVDGWDTINNPQPGITGSYEESRLEMERRRYDTVAKNGHGNASAIVGAIDNLDDVQHVAFEENVSDHVRVMSGVIVPGHSLFLSVLGGNNATIGRTIMEQRNIGCGYAGNTPITVYDQVPETGETIETNMVINRPLPVRCRVQVTIRSIENVTPADISDIIRTEIVATWNGQRNIPRVKSGADIMASDFYCPLQNIGYRYFLDQILVSRMNPVVTTVPEDDLYYDNPTFGRLTKTTEMLVSQYPQFFSFMYGGCFIINDSDAPDPVGWTDWGNSFVSRLDEFPTLVADDVEVIDLAETGL